MKSPARFLFFLFLASGLGLLAGAGAGLEAQPPPAGYAIEVDILPDPERADAFQAEATVTDLESGRVLSRPRVRFLRGASGRGRIRTGTSDGLTIGIQVEVDEEGASALCQSEIWRGEQLVAAHRVRVRLSGREAGE